MERAPGHVRCLPSPSVDVGELDVTQRGVLERLRGIFRHIRTRAAGPTDQRQARGPPRSALEGLDHDPFLRGPRGRRVIGPVNSLLRRRGRYAPRRGRADASTTVEREQLVRPAGRRSGRTRRRCSTRGPRHDLAAHLVLRGARQPSRHPGSSCPARGAGWPERHRLELLAPCPTRSWWRPLGPRRRRVFSSAGVRRVPNLDELFVAARGRAPGPAASKLRVAPVRERVTRDGRLRQRDARSGWVLARRLRGVGPRAWRRDRIGSYRAAAAAHRSRASPARPASSPSASSAEVPRPRSRSPARPTPWTTSPSTPVRREAARPTWRAHPQTSAEVPARGSDSGTAWDSNPEPTDEESGCGVSNSWYAAWDSNPEPTD